MKSLPGVVRAPTKFALYFGRDARSLYSHVKYMPRMLFKRSSPAIALHETSSLPLHEVRVLAQSRGETINDVVLALCAGSLRRDLAEHVVPPELLLTVAVPVSLRLWQYAAQRQISSTVSRLPTDVAEPLPRLAAAQAAGQEAKKRVR